jgi:hypothetical protein
MSHKEALRRAEWEVADVSIEVARNLVKRFHYARGASNTATYLHGLFRRDEFWETGCAGCAWWIPPTRSAAEATYPDNWQGVLCLSRVVCHPDAPRNAASFLVAGSVRLIDRTRWPCLVTYADEWQGHTGAIYRATNWQEAGRTRPEATYTINGRMTARKAGGRTRTKAEMAELGAVCVGTFSRRKFISIAKR